MGVVGGGLRFGFFVVVSVLVASAVISMISSQAVLRDAALVDHSEQVLNCMVEASAHFAEEESAARGYVLTGIPEFEQEYRSGKSKVYKSLRDIQTLTRDKSQQQEGARFLESLAVKRFEDLEDSIQRRKHNLPPLTQSDPRTKDMLETRVQILKALVSMQSDEQLTMGVLQKQSKQSVTWASTGFWSSSIIGCLALTGFFVYIGRYFESIRALRQSEMSRAAELEERVRERTFELSSANKDLEAFSYSVSHDLRAPLRAMHGYASILKRESGSRLNGDDIRMLDRIQLNCSKMSDLIESLLALFRVGKTDLMVEEVNLSSLAADIIQDVQADFPNVQYEIKVASNLKVYGDAQMLRVLLVNLIGNAMKFSSLVPHPLITISREVSSGDQVIAIQDNGAGFDPSQSGLLFEPFQRLHTENEFPGNGVGLAMCRKIVSRHRGSIWLESEMGKGTTVYFTLDLLREARESADIRSKALPL